MSEEIDICLNNNVTDERYDKNVDKPLGGIEEGANNIVRKSQVEEEKMNTCRVPKSKGTFVPCLALSKRRWCVEKYPTSFKFSNKTVYKSKCVFS